ncbi:hypothetical protein N7462_007193 [Penicillium macrosclerotiorum]|uniref:uncharacterized protein n=1 Tax=Penicillium macrosclerotiorum TaxID=303699 RepID=UPI0025481844|nr:uncharacterized protein N7462_007193 [Penicillium macrosclerotiorum]KAJ5678949.1 hypothetical protein N7462_007193 [Penicillium macrosclerotiorum]
MSEWFPRILQFPPETDGWDSDFIMTNLDGRDPPLPMEEIPVSDSWKQHVVEPTKRFERMSWMVLSCALALAHELGVFDSNSHIPLPNDLVGADAENYLEHLELRRQRLPNLLFVFINALSSRIGCTSLMPSDTVLPLPDISLLRRDRKSREWLAFMKSWTELTKLTTSIMNTLFPLMNTALASGSAGTFLSILDQKQTLLADWRQRNLAVADTELGYANILFIEHQHLRVLINSIGMQLVLRRVLSQISLYGGSTIDHFFVEKARELNMTSREYGFIEDVIQGCCQILERITSLGDSGTLYFSPMRILFRTISASIFLMKALALGVRQSKLQEALRILDQAIAALQEKSQDDVHLKLQYATLLQSQAARLRGSLVSSQPTTGPSQPVSEMANRHVPPIEISTDMNQPSEADVQTFFELPTHESMDFDVNEWLYLPFDPSMAPFGEAEGEFGARLDGVDLDLNFLWQLPP